MAPAPKNLLPITASVVSTILISAWAYRHLKRKRSTRTSTSTSTLSSADKENRRASEQRTSNDVVIREINVTARVASASRCITEGKVEPTPTGEEGDLPRILSQGTITIAYCSTTGTCAGFARRLQARLLERLGDPVGLSAVRREYRSVQLIQVNEVDWWDELLVDEDLKSGSAGSPVLLLVLPTWTAGALPPESQVLTKSLREISTDWRVAPEPLRSSDPSCQLKVAAFGMGSSAYDANTVGKPAKEVFATLVGKLGARPLVSKTAGKAHNRRHGKKSKSLMIGDSEAGDSDAVFDKWMEGVLASIFQSLDDGRVGISNVSSKGKAKGGGEAKKQLTQKARQQGSDGKKETDCGSKNTSQNTNSNLQKSSDTDSLSYVSEEDDDYDSDEVEDIVDLEDMGDVMVKQSSALKSKKTQAMVTPKQAKALKKEGYKLIGTHSAVKLCRWTKHQLRGRGGCYKHTHYGITSYQCMEATPSLACANKCVFCWRHHKNPVGREWRWKTDDPKMIVEEAVNMHVDMIRETRGIPGIRMDRWEEAHHVKHCALSLVGEPIMYPRINELLGELHERKISTFLVTNGQHPQAIEDLIPITQLYVSVDASTPESLEAVDRPLFRDAWERLQSSLSCLKRKGQRTVARLTVVKGWNSDEIGGYARLIALGHCSLVEVKGVTFCGKSDASNLNMSNTPWHHEVVHFTKMLLEELKAVREEGGDDPLPEYDLACEHKHSCSVLLARVDQFAVPDPVDPTKRKWKTWIDYDKFQELAKRHSLDPTFKFGVEDYIADTPTWAVYGADEEGFDPTDSRHRKKNKHPKFTRFDDNGVPTHDTFNQKLSTEEVSRLRDQLERRKKEIGDEITVTESHSGERMIDDASLMFRGLTVVR